MARRDRLGFVASPGKDAAQQDRDGGNGGGHGPIRFDVASARKLPRSRACRRILHRRRGRGGTLRHGQSDTIRTQDGSFLDPTDVVGRRVERRSRAAGQRRRRSCPAPHDPDVTYGLSVHLSSRFRPTGLSAIAEARLPGVAARQAAALMQVQTLTDGGQTSLDVARRVASFLDGARETLELALYDFRLHDDTAAIVQGALVGAHERGVHVRLVYNLDEVEARVPIPTPTDEPAWDERRLTD